MIIKSKSIIRLGNVMATSLTSCEKLMVFTLYFYFPPTKCITCKIKLAHAIDISSTCVSTEGLEVVFLDPYGFEMKKCDEIPLVYISCALDLYLN